MARLLVVACQTTSGRELRELLADRAARGPLSVHVVAPVPAVPLIDLGAPLVGGPAWVPELGDVRDEVQAGLDRFVAELKANGIDATGELGPSDPLVALADADEAGGYDELVVSTLPHKLSRWLKMDVPQRAHRKFGDRVTTVVNETFVSPTTGPPHGAPHDAPFDPQAGDEG